MTPRVMLTPAWGRSARPSTKATPSALPDFTEGCAMTAYAAALHRRSPSTALKNERFMALHIMQPRTMP